MSQYLDLIYQMNQTDAAVSQKNNIWQRVCAREAAAHSLHHVLHLLYGNTCVCICSLTAPPGLHAPKKYVDLVRVAAQEELRIRHAMKY